MNLAELLAKAKADSDTFYTGQSALAESTMNQEISNLTAALNSALSQEELSREEANRLYEEGVSKINKEAYQQSQITNLVGHNNGLNFSQQFGAQMQGDQYRKNLLYKGVMSERDKRLAEISNRINLLRQNNDVSVNQARNTYNNQLVSLRSEADRMYNDRALSLEEMLYQHTLNMQAQAAANSGGGGGGYGGGYTGNPAPAKTSSAPAKTNTLAKAVSNYNTAKKTTSLDTYYANQNKARLQAVGFKNIHQLNKAAPIKPPAQNSKISAYTTLNNFKKDFGIKR